MVGLLFETAGGRSRSAFDNWLFYQVEESLFSTQISDFTIF